MCSSDLHELAAALRMGEAIPPSEAGWRQFLALAPASGHTFTELSNLARYWWSRNIPRDLLSSARRQGEQLAALRAPKPRPVHFLRGGR